MAQRDLTAKQEQFCVAISNGFPKNVAYRQSYDCTTMKDCSIATGSSKLLRMPKIKDRINGLRDKQASEAGFGASEVIKMLVAIATADSDELSSYQRVNCRHCYGIDNKHQWLDEDEFAHALAVTISHNASPRGVKSPKQLPNDDGGYGFKLAGQANQDCPKCQGEGVERIFIADTRKLSPQARQLYAGVKRTKEGIEVKQHDKMTALLALAKHFKVIGDGGSVVNVNTTATATVIPETGLPVSAQDAAKIYQKIMKGR